jgi:hypothetical protein
VGAIEQRAFISADEVTIVDFPSMTKEFLDMVTFSGAMKVKFLQTDLSIDKALFSQYTDLFDEMENFYAGTSFST